MTNNTDSAKQPYHCTIDKGDRQRSAAARNLVLEPLHYLTDSLQVCANVTTEVFVSELDLLGLFK